MKSRFRLLSMIMVLFVLGFGIGCQPFVNGTISLTDSLSNNSSVTGDVTFIYPKTLTIGGDNYWNLTELLDINETLERIPSFEADGITAYSGNDIVPLISNDRFLVNVTLLNATILDDHDLVDEGDIYFNVTINGNFTETGNYAANDGETIDVNLEGYYAWCMRLNIDIAIWDDDTPSSPDDELGTYHFETNTPTSGIVTGYTYYLDGNLGDAEVWVKIEVVDTSSEITAEFLADGCKPYLYFTDETSHTEEADEVFARVLVGQDAAKGTKSVFCLQYIYYWGEEYFPDPITVQFHEDDYEEFLIFIDPDDLFNPYRYVFDDGSYVSNTRSSRMAIWENSATTSILETEANVYEDLIPLLGDNYTTDYKIFNLAGASSELRNGTSGVRTMNILVQTSFHNFQEGPPGLFDLFPNELGYDYEIDELNDSMLRYFFRRHYASFEAGLWFISAVGIDTPKIHPFTFDIMDPFKFPYVKNAYANVVDDIERFQKAEKNWVEYEYDIELTLAFLIKAQYTITAPDAVEPGDQFDATVEVEILEDETEIAFFYDIFLNSTTEVLFYKKNFLYDYEGKIGVNIPLATIKNIMTLFGFNPYEKSDVGLDQSGYLTLDTFSLAPTLLGNIMSTSMSLHFWEIIKGQLPIYFPVTLAPLTVFDYFIDSIDLKMDAELNGFVNGTIGTSDLDIANSTVEEFEFDGTTISTTTEITVDNDITNGTTFDIVLDDLAYIFEFMADWSFEINFCDIIALIAPEYGHMSWDLGTMPNVQYGSADSFQESSATVTKTTTVLTDVSTTKGGMEFYLISATITVTLSAIVVCRKSKK